MYIIISSDHWNFSAQNFHLRWNIESSQRAFRTEVGYAIPSSQRMRAPVKPQLRNAQKIGAANKIRKCQLLSRIYPKEVPEGCKKSKKQRTRSHDPTSSLRIRGSIQAAEDNNQISVDCELRNNSERRQRKKSRNVTMLHQNHLPQIHSQRTLILPDQHPRPSKFKLVNLNLNKKLKLQNKNNLQNFQSCQNLEHFENFEKMGVTAEFGQFNKYIKRQLPSSRLFEKVPILTPNESRVGSPSQSSFLFKKEFESQFSSFRKQSFKQLSEKKIMPKEALPR